MNATNTSAFKAVQAWVAAHSDVYGLETFKHGFTSVYRVDDPEKWPLGSKAEHPDLQAPADLCPLLEALFDLEWDLLTLEHDDPPPGVGI